MAGDAHLEELRRFLAEHVEELDELVVLAFLETRGSEGAPLSAVVEAVPFTEATARAVLERLAARELVSCSALEPAEYRFAPADPATRAELERVFTTYRENPIVVMNLMTANAIERVRTAALRTFADAFRIGRPKSNG